MAAFGDSSTCTSMALMTALGLPLVRFLCTTSTCQGRSRPESFIPAKYPNQFEPQPTWTISRCHGKQNTNPGFRNYNFLLHLPSAASLAISARALLQKLNEDGIFT
ncbi:hypothetical protein BDZ45DRAFT_60021 [Acephala macrosclerotiorum]|nr:hypothetical protein BDZ45DRAFT_60021 [Acephala macrosclerotiorum]